MELTTQMLNVLNECEIWQPFYSFVSLLQEFGYM